MKKAGPESLVSPCLFCNFVLLNSNISTSMMWLSEQTLLLLWINPKYLNRMILKIELFTMTADDGLSHVGELHCLTIIWRFSVYISFLPSSQQLFIWSTAQFVSSHMAGMGSCVSTFAAQKHASLDFVSLLHIYKIRIRCEIYIVNRNLHFISKLKC